MFTTCRCGNEKGSCSKRFTGFTINRMGFTPVDIANRMGHEIMFICFQQSKMKLQASLMLQVDLGRQCNMDEQRSKNKKDEHNRKRDTIVNFRMPPDERGKLEKRIQLSDRRKQEYMIQSTLYQQIVVIENKALFRRIEERF